MMVESEAEVPMNDLRTPALPQVQAIGRRAGFGVSAEDYATFAPTMTSLLSSFDRVWQLAGQSNRRGLVNRASYRPSSEDNLFNAWYVRCDVRGRADGRLAGLRVALKDNICLSGVPMMNGTSLLQDYVPDVDATIVSRLLEAGVTIVGKATCEPLCLSGSSFLSESGAVHNPWDQSRSAGGSSSGCAAVVAGRICDAAIGSDQGGSIRIPAAWCGVVGLKPTFGLIPFTGCFPNEMTLDTVGPMSVNVSTAAQLLDVLAGEDGLDPRQCGVRPIPQNNRSVAGDLVVGVLDEAFGWPGVSDPQVDTDVLQVARELSGTGAHVVPVTVPLHRDGPHIQAVIATEGGAMLIGPGNAVGSNWRGQYTVSLLDAFARAKIALGDQLPDRAKLRLLVGHYVHDVHHGSLYAMAQNLALQLRAAYDEALERCDVLLMPTVPRTAPYLPHPDASRAVKLRMSGERDNVNTAPFSVTGHPAITVPCGTIGGLPIGVMLVGRRGDDATVLRAAAIVEELRGTFVPDSAVDRSP